TRQAAIEQPVVALGALRIVTADIKDVPASNQRWLCAHARSIRHEEPPPLRRWSSRDAWLGSCAPAAGPPFRTAPRIPRPFARARRTATSLASRASGPGSDARQTARAIRAPARARAAAWRNAHWRECECNRRPRSRAADGG